MSAKRHLSLALLAAALVTVPVAPAGAASVPTGFQFSNFRLAEGTRYILSLSAPKPIPGVSQAAFPKGFREVCSMTGPKLRFRTRFSSDPDGGNSPTQFGVAVKYRRPGVGSYAPLATGPSKEAVSLQHLVFSADAPFLSDVVPAEFVDLFRPNYEGLDAATLPAAPAKALFDLSLTPRTTYFTNIVTALSTPLTYLQFPVNQAAVIAKLDVRYVSDAECAPAAGSYHRWMRVA